MSNAQPPIDDAARQAAYSVLLRQAPEKVVADLLRTYREQGVMDGYFRGTNDVLMSLAAFTEDYLGKQPDTAAEELRPLLYGLIEYLDYRIRGLTNQQVFVEGGLGI